MRFFTVLKVCGLLAQKHVLPIKPHLLSFFFSQCFRPSFLAHTFGGVGVGVGVGRCFFYEL